MFIRKENEMVYEWKTGYYKTDAETAAAVFKQLENSATGLTAASLVDASRSEDAPLHNEFEWDDSVAGEEWRKQQARVMIGALVVRVEEKPPVRKYVSIETTSPKYESIDVVIKNEEKTAALLAKALNELAAFERKYATLQELAGVFREAKKIRERKKKTA